MSRNNARAEGSAKEVKGKICSWSPLAYTVKGTVVIRGLIEPGPPPAPAPAPWSGKEWVAGREEEEGEEEEGSASLFSSSSPSVLLPPQLALTLEIIASIVAASSLRDMALSCCLGAGRSDWNVAEADVEGDVDDDEGRVRLSLRAGAGDDQSGMKRQC